MPGLRHLVRTPLTDCAEGDVLVKWMDPQDVEACTAEDTEGVVVGCDGQALRVLWDGDTAVTELRAEDFPWVKRHRRGGEEIPIEALLDGSQDCWVEPYPPDPLAPGGIEAAQRRYWHLEQGSLTADEVWADAEDEAGRPSSESDLLQSLDHDDDLECDGV